jgi:radical SAM superfamily enzyme YgiQ (UPF0313 family)
MSQHRVSFVNPNFSQGPKELNAHYLPYSPAVIWSYVNQFPHITDRFMLGDFVWCREPIEIVAKKLADSRVVGLSTYIWNKKYNTELAKALKKLNPEILIVQGGPEPPIENKEFFSLYPFIDICVKQEGEVAFKRILENLDGDFMSIKGLLVNENGKTINTGVSSRIENLDEIPSPYLTGIFDDLIAANPGAVWNATLETNRGCPYQCTFCDWGSLTYNKIKKFGLERVFQELDWIGEHHCDFLSITDANFGIFPERDSLIADKLIEIQQTHGFPTSYTISWAKNQKREIVEIVKKLIFVGGAKIGLNLSVQTLDENTLDIIKRKNLETNRIQEVFDLCEANNIPLYTELILGLPGETLETWKANFFKLFKIGNHTGITVYQAQLLENAEMNLSQREKYQLQGSTVYDYLIGTYNNNELEEGLEVVFATKDLPPEIMLEAQVYSWFINTFHINGITNYISRFLYKYAGVEYEEFYEKLRSFIENDTWLMQEVDRVRKHYKNWATYGRIMHPLVQGIEIHGWNLIHSTLIMMHSQHMVEHVFNHMETFVKENYMIESDILDDLFACQKAFLIRHERLKEYPIKITTKHDVLGYVIHDLDLQSPGAYMFDFPESKDMTLQRFCENIFFARRRNFGKAWIERCP